MVYIYRYIYTYIAITLDAEQSAFHNWLENSDKTVELDLVMAAPNDLPTPGRCNNR